MRHIRKAGSGWLLTVAVLTVVLGAGSRLIYFSVQHHKAVVREEAASLAAGFVGKIESQVRALTALAVRQAEVGAGHAAGAAGTRWPLAPGAFWLGADDQVLAVQDPEAALAAAISGEWAALEA